MVLAIGAALVAALVVRQASGPEAARRLALVAAVALGVRLAAVTAIYLIAIRSHAEGTFFNDEASFYLAAESLLPNPLDKPLPTGLEHLGTDAYLGLLTGLSLALGSSYSHMDTVAFRLVNATLGTLVAITTSIITARLVGNRAALVAGLLVALWPTLVLWSATFLRDTLASFIVVVTWWTLVFHRRWTDVRVLGVVLLAWLLLATLRPYLAGALTLGVIGWAVWPLIPGRSPRVLAASAAALVVLGVAVAALQARRIDESAHQLVYRQLTTRMETQGRLYRDSVPNDPPYEPPFRPGAAVATIDPDSGWISPGLIDRPLGPGLVLVAFPDGSEQLLRIADLTLLQSAPLSPLQLLLSIQPGLITFLSGTSDAGEREPGLGGRRAGVGPLVRCCDHRRYPSADTRARLDLSRVHRSRHDHGADRRPGRARQRRSPSRVSSDPAARRLRHRLAGVAASGIARVRRIGEQRHEHANDRGHRGQLTHSIALIAQFVGARAYFCEIAGRDFGGELSREPAAIHSSGLHVAATTRLGENCIHDPRCRS